MKKSKKLNIFLKHKLKILALFCLVLFYIILKLCFFNKTEFVVLEQMTRIDRTENNIGEIILVKNHPNSSSKLKEMIFEFNSKRKLKFDNIQQTFIKERNYKFLPALTLSENYSYEDKNIKSEKLDNIDFLARRVKYINWNKRVIDTIYLFIGKYDCYKN